MSKIGIGGGISEFGWNLELKGCIYCLGAASQWYVW